MLSYGSMMEDDRDGWLISYDGQSGPLPTCYLTILLGTESGELERLGSGTV